MQRQINAVIFDLDEVLYDEQQYFYAAFDKIAGFLSEQSKFTRKQILNKLVVDLQKKSSMYPRLFNDLLSEFNLEQVLLKDVLALFSTVKPDLSLYLGVENLLQSLKDQKIKLGLLTNGNVETQQNKVSLLKLEKYFDAIMYARTLGICNEKPNPKAFSAILSALHIKPEEAIYVGDNPHTDFLGAKKLGIKTIRLRTGEFKDVHLGLEFEAELTAESVAELDLIIMKELFGTN
jgi:putative hydrolase of the HAD superfamily